MKVYYIREPEDVIHYGVKGMKWGVRKEDYSEKPNVKWTENQYLTNGGRIKRGASISRLTTSMYGEKHTGSTFNSDKIKQIDMRTKVDLILQSMKRKGWGGH